MGKFEHISKANFSDRVEQIDLNNIQDNQGGQQRHQGNPVNLNNNPFMLFLNTLLPWVDLPNVEEDLDMPFIEENDQ